MANFGWFARLSSQNFNIGSEEMVTINQLAKMVMEIAGKDLEIRHIPGPQGVRGRNSDNKLISERLDWRPTDSLRAGLEQTYQWIADQILQGSRLAGVSKSL